MNGQAAVNLPDFYDAAPAPARLRDEVIDGLTRRPKALSPKFFYDERGSRLFDAICLQPEYYPTRTEMAILRARSADIAAMIGPGAVVVEPGAGSCQKVEVLLEAVRPAAYVPADISGTHVRQAASDLVTRHPWLSVTAACADFTQFHHLAGCVPPGRRVVFFPGSTIGNFEPSEARRFLEDVAAFVQPDGGLLIGVDLKKDPALLNAAYNDRSGITAAFNRNLLQRINRELSGDFVCDRFHHRAFYNPEQGRVEMHLISDRRQQVRVDGHWFDFERDENIHTENSYKYDLGQFQLLGRRAGLIPRGVWLDPRRLFSVHWLTAA